APAENRIIRKFKGRYSLVFREFICALPGSVNPNAALSASKAIRGKLYALSRIAMVIYSCTTSRSETLLSGILMKIRALVLSFICTVCCAGYATNALAEQLLAQTYPIQNIREIFVGGGAKIEIIQGETESLRAEARKE